MVLNFDKLHKKSMPKERNFVYVIGLDKVVLCESKFKKATSIGGLRLKPS